MIKSIQKKSCGANKLGKRSTKKSKSKINKIKREPCNLNKGNCKSKHSNSSNPYRNKGECPGKKQVAEKGKFLVKTFINLVRKVREINMFVVKRNVMLKSIKNVAKRNSILRSSIIVRVRRIHVKVRRLRVKLKSFV